MIRHRLALLVASLALVACGSSAGSESPSGDDARPRPAVTLDPAEVDRQPALVATLERRLRREVPRAYGCVVLAEDGGAPATVRLVPDAVARRRARRVVRSLGAADEVVIETATQEERHELRQDLLRRLRADAPAGVDDIRLSYTSDAGRCRRVVIQLPGDAGPDVEAWAERMVSLFGARRLMVEVLEINLFSD